MANNRLWIVAVPLALGALGFYASHTYEENMAYKTGVYIGTAAFNAENIENRRCFSLDSVQRGCEVNDLNNDAVMEGALASANIIPSLADSADIHTGFRDGWREARRAASAK